MKKKYFWYDDEDRAYEVFSETAPCPEAEEEECNGPIEFSYHPDAYEDDEEKWEETEKMVGELNLPKNKKVRVDFTVDGDPYYLEVTNLDNGFYKGVVISNDRQDIDPGDLCWLKKKYVEIICNKLKKKD